MAVTDIVINGSSKIGEIVSWSVTETGTPHDLSDSSGSIGSASITTRAIGDSFWAIEDAVEIIPDAIEGSFSGHVTDVSIQPSTISDHAPETVRVINTYENPSFETVVTGSELPGIDPLDGVQSSDWSYQDSFSLHVLDGHTVVISI